MIPVKVKESSNLSRKSLFHGTAAAAAAAIARSLSLSGAAGILLGDVCVGPLPSGVRDDLYLLPGWQGPTTVTAVSTWPLWIQNQIFYRTRLDYFYSQTTHSKASPISYWWGKAVPLQKLARTTHSRAFLRVVFQILLEMKSEQDEMLNIFYKSEGW
jgi:hypothetical protein